MATLTVHEEEAICEAVLIIRDARLRLRITDFDTSRAWGTLLRAGGHLLNYIRRESKQ